MKWLAELLHFSSTINIQIDENQYIGYDVFKFMVGNDNY